MNKFLFPSKETEYMSHLNKDVKSKIPKKDQNY